MTLIRITPDKRRIRSILKQNLSTLDLIKEIDTKRFTSNILKEYYEVIRGLISARLMLDGFKTFGEGSHKELIDYVKDKGYLNIVEIDFIKKMRIHRDDFIYEGKMTNYDFLEEKHKKIKNIIEKLLKLTEKISENTPEDENVRCKPANPDLSSAPRPYKHRHLMLVLLRSRPDTVPRSDGHIGQSVSGKDPD